MKAIELKTIELFASSHSYHNKWKSPVEIGEEDEDEATDAWAAWRDGHSVSYNKADNLGAPESLELVAQEDDGETHDVSRINYWKSEELGLAVYSYNNNAWGHCDVLPLAEDPGSIEEWLNNWDELPEKWMRELAGIEEEEEA
jgi:hypothetical protein